MRQTGRRTFLRLMAGATLSGTILDALLRKLAVDARKLVVKVSTQARDLLVLV